MSDDEGSAEVPPPSLAATRSRREKSDKFGRFAALKKYKVVFFQNIWFIPIIKDMIDNLSLPKMLNAY